MLMWSLLIPLLLPSPLLILSARPLARMSGLWFHSSQISKLPAFSPLRSNQPNLEDLVDPPSVASEIPADSDPQPILTLMTESGLCDDFPSATKWDPIPDQPREIERTSYPTLSLQPEGELEVAVRSILSSEETNSQETDIGLDFHSSPRDRLCPGPGSPSWFF